MRLAAEQGIDPALMHRVAVIGAGTLDSLPHNGAVVTLLAVCSSTHRESYLDIVMVAIVGALLGLVAVIGLGTAFGSFWLLPRARFTSPASASTTSVRCSCSSCHSS